MNLNLNAAEFKIIRLYTRWGGALVSKLSALVERLFDKRQTERLLDPVQQVLL